MRHSIELAPDLPVTPHSDEARRRYRYAHRMAWCLHPKAEIASAIASEAIAGLPKTYEAQVRRLEYTPKGEFRTRISMEPDQLILRRVFALSDEYEKQREQSGEATKEDLIVYFIKDALRAAFKRSSFHMAVAVGRILHSYRTQEVMNIYSTISPQRSITKNDGQYRTWKKKLMDKLEKRFKPYVSTFKGPRGEKRFVPETDEKLLEFAQDCLRFFVPLNTGHVISDKCGADGPRCLSYEGLPDGEHRTELLRLHACICPDCFESLAEIWKLSKPVEKLAIPAFRLPSNTDPNYFDRDKLPVLTDAEVDARLDEIAAAQERSRKISPESLRVLVDGRKKATITPYGYHNISIKLREDDEIIQVVSEEGDVLVTHLASFGDEDSSYSTICRYEIAGVAVEFIDNPANAEGRILDIRVEGKLHRQMTRIVLAGSIGPLFWPRLETDKVKTSKHYAAPVFIGRVQGGTSLWRNYLERAWNSLEWITLRDNPVIKQEGPISRLRSLTQSIDKLTNTQAKLYEQYCVIATKRGINLDVVPHVDEHEEQFSKNWLLAAISMFASGVGLLVGGLPLISQVPLSIGAFALVGWHFRKWSERLTSKYWSNTERLESLQEIMHNSQGDSIDPFFRLRKLFADADKRALLVGDDQEWATVRLPECLETNGYVLHRAKGDCNILNSEAGAVSWKCSVPGTILVYFASHGKCDFCTTRSRYRIWSRNFIKRPVLFAGSDLNDGVFRWSELRLSTLRSPLSFFKDQVPAVDRKREQMLNGIVTDGLKGAAAGSEGLITFSDLAWYVKKRLSNPDLVREIGQWTVVPRYSDDQSGDIVLGGTVPQVPMADKGAITHPE